MSEPDKPNYLPGCHHTCTSSNLSPDPENIPLKVIDKLVEEKFGVPVSKDPNVATIQREQALVKDKREKKGIA